MLTRLRVLLSISGLLLFGFAGATTVTAQVGTTTPTTTTPTTTTPVTTTTPQSAEVIEWDLSNLQTLDQQPGAITADLYGNSSGTVWFSTRLGDGTTPPRVYQFQPPANYKYGSAQATSWPMDPGVIGPSGGLKRIRSSHDSRDVYVRTPFALEKIDMTGRISTTYCDTLVAPTPGTPPTCDTSTPSPVSDVAVDSNKFVYYTFNGMLQRVDTSFDCGGQYCPPVTATRWNLSTAPGAPVSFVSTAGICNGNTSGNSPDTDPCLSGVAVHPRYQNLVYVAEPGNDTIAEIDTSVQPCATPQTNVRRWDLSKIGVYQPRQINFDQDGLLWIITGPDPTLSIPSLVSLDPKTSVLTRYDIPKGFAQDTFGVAPDGGMIGYTSNDSFDESGAPATAGAGSDPTEHKVGVLIPQGGGTTVYPQCSWAQPNTFTLPAYCIPVCPTIICIKTTVRQVPAKIVPSSNGTFIEGLINRNSDGGTQTSYYPLGIAPAFKKAVGTFLYAVGSADDPNFNRVGFIRLPRKGFKAKHEREDKDCNDDGTGKDDQDHDGVPDQYKTSDSKAKMDRQNDSLSPGQSMDYNLTTTSSTMAIVAAIQSDNALEPVSVQVLDPNGINLALPVPTPGLAVATVVPTVPGNYTIRVKNEGALPINPETQLITREPLSLP